MNIHRLPTVALAATALIGLFGCDNGPSAVVSRDAGPAADVAPADVATRGDPRDAPVPLVDGKPMWSANSHATAQQNARRAFARNGEAFGAKDLDDFVAKAHAFVSDPPAGAETIRRANGDRLIYDPKTNVFAVATRQGAPRTMFKPDDGADYWRQQKTREARRGEDGRDDRG